jgi:hypothetical protein
VLVVVAALTVDFTMRAAEPKPAPAPPTTSSFDGKLVLVYSGKGNSESCTTLQGPSVVQIGDRAFIRGIAVKGGDFTKTPFEGRQVWLPVNEIERLIVYDNADQMKLP